MSRDAAAARRVRADLFEHEALFYNGPAEYAAGCGTFVRDALGAGRPVLVAAPQPNIDLLGSALGDAGSQVRFLDMTAVGRNPGRIIPDVLHAFAQEHRGRWVSIIGEPIWPGRSPAEYRAAVQHESLINLAFAGRTATILCPYDTAGLVAEAVADAERTHPVILQGGARQSSGPYLEPATMLSGLAWPPPSPPERALTLRFESADLRPVRDFVRRNAPSAGLPAGRVVDLLVAVNEAATNTVTHTASGAGSIRLWQADGGTVCEVRDAGTVGDLLAGRLPPGPNSQRGRGLLIINQLCDLVETWFGQAGTVLRMHMRT